MLYFAEISAAKPGLVHLLALCLLAGRLSHAFGVSQVNENYRFRLFGMAMTFATLIVASVFLLYACALKGIA